MKKNGSYFQNFFKKNLATILALTVSLLTLFVYVRQTNILSEQTKLLAEQTRASLWPHVCIESSISHGGFYPLITSFSIIVRNDGTGPAIVEHVVLKINGIEVETWDDFEEKVSPPFEFGYSNDGLFDKVIMPGESIKFVEFSNNFELLNYLYSEHFDHLEIAICYKSIYNEYWTVVNKGFGNKQTVVERYQSDACKQNVTYFIE